MFVRVCFFFNDTATTEIYTLSLHDALPISRQGRVEHYDAVHERVALVPEGEGRPAEQVAARVVDVEVQGVRAADVERRLHRALFGRVDGGVEPGGVRRAVDADEREAEGRVRRGRGRVRVCARVGGVEYVYLVAQPLQGHVAVRDACALVDDVEVDAYRHGARRSEEHTSELQSRQYLVCRLLLE